MWNTRGSLGVTCAATLPLLVLVGCSAEQAATVPKSRAVSDVAAGPTAAQTMSAGSDSEDTMNTKTELATFGAGCFWGVEQTFREVEGVVATTVGYAGGTLVDPTYKDVCSDQTGHAEVVQVEFDPERVSYGQLLDVFWNCHNPTTLDRQGPDVGTQYRSVIFCHTPQQEATARASRERQEQSGRFKRPIVTQIMPAGAFYPAEEYHQQYLAKRGRKTCASTNRE